jgi:hypothetical protein
MPFTVGQRVLVHQSQGLFCDDAGVWHRIPHDCSKPEQHWKSRILKAAGEDHYPLPRIATEVRGDAPSISNTCSCSWPYTEESLTLLDDGSADWADTSRYKIGDRVTMALDVDTPQYKMGTILEARLIAPHIETGDWYLGFFTPEPHVWEFTKVVHEMFFRPTEVPSE